jgi:hypothetical protein
MDLREWTVLYVKHKDLFARKLQGYKEVNGKEGEKIVFAFKDHELHAYAMESLMAPPKATGKTLVTTLNTAENQQTLIRRWDDFAAIPHLTIVFVNPQKNEKWFIMPHTHAMISDPNIELGIRSLAENVPLVE